MVIWFWWEVDVSQVVLIVKKKKRRRRGMKRRAQWLLHVVCALGVCGTALAGADETVKGQAGSMEKPAKTIHVPEEAATMHAESEKLCEQFGEREKGTCATAFHLYSAGFEFSNQADDMEKQTEKVRLYDEAATMYTKAAKLYEQLGEHKSRAEALKNAGNALRKQVDNTGKQAERVSLYEKALAGYGKTVTWFVDAGLRLQGQDNSKEQRVEKLLLYKEAATMSTEAAKLFEILGAKKDRAEALKDAGGALYGQAANTEKEAEVVRLSEEAVVKFTEAAKLYERLGEKSECAGVLGQAGVVAGLAAVLDLNANTERRLEAVRLFNEAARMYEQLGDKTSRAFMLVFSGIAEFINPLLLYRDRVMGYGRVERQAEKVNLSEVEAAIARFTEALKLFEQLGDEQLVGKLGRLVALFLTGVALSYQADNTEEQAEKVRLYGEAVAKFTEIGKVEEQFLKFDEPLSDRKEAAKLVTSAMSTISHIVGFSATGLALREQASSTEQQTEKVQLYEKAAAKFTEIASWLTEETRFTKLVQLWLPFEGDADKTGAISLALSRQCREWALRQAGFALLGQADSAEERAEKVRLFDEAAAKFFEEAKLCELNGGGWFPNQGLVLALRKYAVNAEKLGEKIHLYKEIAKLHVMNAWYGYGFITGLATVGIAYLFRLCIFIGEQPVRR